MSFNHAARIKLVSRVVAVVGMTVTAAPTVMAGSMGWSLAVVVAAIVVYYAGASTAIAGMQDLPPG